MTIPRQGWPFLARTGPLLAPDGLFVARGGVRVTPPT